VIQTKFDSNLKVTTKWKNMKTSLTVFSFGEGQGVGRGSVCVSETSARAIFVARFVTYVTCYHY